MRILLAGLIGLLLGAAAAAAVLYFNPLTHPDDTLRGTDGGVRLRYTTAESGTLAFTHGARLEQIEIRPPSIASLWESALAKTALAVLVMTDENDAAAALASRIAKVSPRTNPITSGVLLVDTWLITVPGNGTYFIESNSNLWPFLRDTVVDVGLLRRPWSEPREYRVTEGPDLSGAAAVTGATGLFRNATGTAVDTLRLDGLRQLAELSEPIEGVLELSLTARDSDGEAADALNVARENP